MDEVMAQVVPKFLRLYEQHFGIKPNSEDYHGKKLYQLPGAKELREALFAKGFFRDLPVMPGSQEVIKELLEDYEVFVVTAAMEFRNSFEDKYDWLQEHFPFISWKKVVFCGYKSVIRADYMIDDHVHNLEAFEGKGLLFTATHNVDENRFERVNNWEEVRQFFEREKSKS